MSTPVDHLGLLQALTSVIVENTSDPEAAVIACGRKWAAGLVGTQLPANFRQRPLVERQAYVGSLLTSLGFGVAPSPAPGTFTVCECPLVNLPGPGPNPAACGVHLAMLEALLLPEQEPGSIEVLEFKPGVRCTISLESERKPEN